MQDRLTTTCLGPANELIAVQEESGSAMPVEIFHISEVDGFVAGYKACIEEVFRYLNEVEEYSEEHPVVEELLEHLSRTLEKIVDQDLMVQA